MKGALGATPCRLLNWRPIFLAHRDDHRLPNHLRADDARGLDALAWGGAQ